MKLGGTLLAAVVMLAASWQPRGSPAHTAAYAMKAVAAGDFVAAHPTMGLQTRLDTRGATLSKPGESWHVTLGGSASGAEANGGRWVAGRGRGQRVRGTASPTRGARTEWTYESGS